MWWFSMILSSWPDNFHILGCMWWFTMILSSWPDNFPISVCPQCVCDGLNDPVSSWPDYFPISVCPQAVCDASQESCQVNLIISQSLSIPSEYVMVLNDPVKLTWQFPHLRMYVMIHHDPVKLTWQFSNFCLSSVCMWWFVKLTWPFSNLCPSLGCMCSFPCELPRPFSDHCLFLASMSLSFILLSVKAHLEMSVVRKQVLILSSFFSSEFNNTYLVYHLGPFSHLAQMGSCIGYLWVAQDQSLPNLCDL